MSTRGDQPSSSRAFEPSTDLLGCPSGFDGSQTKRPSKPVTFAMSSARSAIEISDSEPRLTGSPIVQALEAEDDPFGRIVDVEELARCPSCPPQDDLVAASLSIASSHFLMIAGMTWLVLSSKLSPGPKRLEGMTKTESNPYSSR